MADVLRGTSFSLSSCYPPISSNHSKTKDRFNKNLSATKKLFVEAGWFLRTTQQRRIFCSELTISLCLNCYFKGIIKVLSRSFWSGFSDFSTQKCAYQFLNFIALSDIISLSLFLLLYLLRLLHPALNPVSAKHLPNQEIILVLLPKDIIFLPQLAVFPLECLVIVVV